MVHSAKGDWQSKASEHTFVLQAFGAEETLYLDLKDQQSIELDQFTQLFNQQIFKLDHLPTIEEGDFEKLVDKAIQQIDEGLLQKVVLARQQFYPTDTNPLILFKAICAAYDNCFVHLIYEPNGKCSIGASPELLLSNNHEGIKSVSMAGTIIDGSSEFTSKEEEEQAFVTQYITAQFESMGFQPQIHDHSIENNNVTHLYSTIETSKKVDAEKADELLKKLHPTPAVCGYPLEASRSFIQSEEGLDRSWYSGYMGVKNAAELKMYVNLRCARLYQGKALLYAGAGITKDSNAAAEFMETEAKMDVIRRFL